MYTCPVCSKEFAIYFIYDLHFTKCKENNMKMVVGCGGSGGSGGGGSGSGGSGGGSGDDDGDDDGLVNSLSILSYKNKHVELSKKLDMELDMNTNIINEIKREMKQLELRICRLEKRDNKISNLRPPMNDYMNWVRSLKITEEDKENSLSDLVGTIKDILIRNNFQTCGIFYKWYCGKDMNMIKILVGKKVVGTNMIILGYKWEYMNKNELTVFVDYFWNIFKTELIDWYNKNMGGSGGSGGGGSAQIVELYNKYYKNVMLISENCILKKMKEFIVKNI
jgi:hypothetical protein